MLTILALIEARDGQSAQLGEALLANVAPTLMEEGCISYDVHHSNDGLRLWMMYENWSSQERLDAHFEQPYMKRPVARLPTLTKGALRIRKFTRTSEAAR